MFALDALCWLEWYLSWLRCVYKCDADAEVKSGHLVSHRQGHTQRWPHKRSASEPASQAVLWYVLIFIPLSLTYNILLVIHWFVLRTHMVCSHISFNYSEIWKLIWVISFFSFTVFRWCYRFCHLTLVFSTLRCDELRQYIDGLVEDCSSSIANAMELLQSCTKPSKCTYSIVTLILKSRMHLEYFLMLRKDIVHDHVTSPLCREFTSHLWIPHT